MHAPLQELTSRAQNIAVPMWLSDGNDEEVGDDYRYLKCSTLLPVPLGRVCDEKKRVVNERYAFLGRLFAKVATSS